MITNISSNPIIKKDIEYKFNKYATNYDNSRQQLIPCFSEFYRTVVKIIPFSTSINLSILDIGSGTGLLTELIAKKFRG